MKERNQQSEIKPILRDNFGPGKAGEIAYLTIISGAFCEVILTNPCNNISDRTIGFDVSGNYELVPACSSKHEAVIKKRVKKDLQKIGQIVSFDSNGFGRA